MRFSQNINIITTRIFSWALILPFISPLVACNFQQHDGASPGGIKISKIDSVLSDSVKNGSEPVKLGTCVPSYLKVKQEGNSENNKSAKQYTSIDEAKKDLKNVFSEIIPEGIKDTKTIKKLYAYPIVVAYQDAYGKKYIDAKTRKERLLETYILWFRTEGCFLTKKVIDLEKANDSQITEALLRYLSANKIDVGTLFKQNFPNLADIDENNIPLSEISGAKLVLVLKELTELKRWLIWSNEQSSGILKKGAEGDKASRAKAEIDKRMKKVADFHEIIIDGKKYYVDPEVLNDYLGKEGMVDAEAIDGAKLNLQTEVIKEQVGRNDKTAAIFCGKFSGKCVQ